MELVKQSAAWFSTEAACKQYAELKTLEDRSVFLYSYLRSLSSETMDQSGFVFKMAFFLADAVANSKLPYAAYPDIVDGTKNPFVALMMTLKKPYDNDAMYCVMMAILCGVANPMNQNDWIYDKSLFADKKAYRQKLESLDRGFLPSSDAWLADPAAFAVDEGLEFARAELIWMFRQAG